MTEFIEIEGKRIEVDQEIRDPKRPTLVFLHEGLGCVSMWRDFPTEVAEVTKCNQLVYSRLGYGQSDTADLPRPTSYMHDEALLTLPAVLSACRINQHILVGHSDGGSIALIYAGHFRPKNLLGIITEAAHVFNEALSVQSVKEAQTAYLNTNLRQKLARHHRHVDNAFWGWNDVWRHPDFQQWNIEAYLPMIDVPLLAIQGLDDQYGTLAQVEAIMEGVGKTAEKKLIPDCKHVPHREQPALTFDATVDFVQRVIGANSHTV